MTKMKEPVEEQLEVRALIMHHHISSIIPAEPPRDKLDISITLDAARLIDRALDAGIGLVFHGHQHYPCITKMGKTRFIGGQIQSFIPDQTFVSCRVAVLV